MNIESHVTRKALVNYMKSLSGIILTIDEDLKKLNLDLEKLKENQGDDTYDKFVEEFEPLYNKIHTISPMLKKNLKVIHETWQPVLEKYRKIR